MTAASAASRRPAAPPRTYQVGRGVVGQDYANATVGLPMSMRKRGASAVLFGLPGQEVFEENKDLQRSVSFKLTGVDGSGDGRGDVGSEPIVEVIGAQSAVPMPPHVKKKQGLPKSGLLRSRSMKTPPRAAPPEGLSGAAPSPRALAISRSASSSGETWSHRRVGATPEAAPRPKQAAADRKSRPTSYMPTVPVPVLSDHHPLPSEPGKGSILWANGSVVYEGETRTYLVNNYPHGVGVLRWKEEHWGCQVVFTPQAVWQLGSTKAFGTLRFEDGHVFEGEVTGPGVPGPQLYENTETGESSKPPPVLRAQGQGKMRYANGDAYVGAWNRTLREGKGRVRAKAGWTFEGAWKQDQRNGAGVHIDAAGGVMVGRWENDLPREAIMTWPNGDVYDGWWTAPAYKHFGDPTSPLWRLEPEREPEDLVLVGPRQFLCTFKEGPIGVRFKDDTGDSWPVARHVDAGLASELYPQLVPGCKLISIRGVLMDGLTFKEATEKVSMRERPVDMVWELPDNDGNTDDPFMKSSSMDRQWMQQAKRKTKRGFDHTKYCREGRGCMKWADGAVFEGDWRADGRHGRGLMKYANGDLFRGNWRNDCVADNMVGLMQRHDGSIYEGQWLREREHGKGVLTYANGDVFTGTFEQGSRADGYGKLVQASGVTYEGEWVAEIPHGQGTKIMVDGLTFTGEWHQGTRVAGRQEWPNGDTFIGQWAFDVPHGEGVFSYKESGEKFEGEFENGARKDGYGIMTYKNKDEYSGEWVNLLRHGRGLMRYGNGNTFDGQWVRGARRDGEVVASLAAGTYKGGWKHERPHGNGILSFVDGGLYEGQWNAGLRHGYGGMRNGPWRSYVGEWKFDRFDGEGTLTDLRSRSTFVGTFVRGVKHGDGKESYGFIDANFVGSWAAGKKQTGVFTFPDGTRWARTYAKDGSLITEHLLGDKNHWKHAVTEASLKRRTLLSGDTEVISNREIFHGVSVVADASGRPIQTPSILPHIRSL
eukprot:COSAG05_NODE_1996_length_3729_cov_2.633333_1_plen_988_part_10